MYLRKAAQLVVDDSTMPAVVSDRDVCQAALLIVKRNGDALRHYDPTGNRGQDRGRHRRP